MEKTIDDIRLSSDIRLCRAERQSFREALDTFTSHASVVLSTAPRLLDSNDRMLLIETRLEKMCKELQYKEIELQNRSLALDERAKVVEAKEAIIADLEIKADRYRKDMEEKAGQMSEMVESLRKTQGEFSVEKEHLFGTQTYMKESEEEIERKRKRASR